MRSSEDGDNVSKRTPRPPSRDTRIEIENDCGQVIELVLSGVVRVNTAPASVLSEVVRVRDQGFTVHETESPTVVGTLLEHLPPTKPFAKLNLGRQTEPATD